MVIKFSQILEIHAQELVQQDIAAITGNSRPKISKVIRQAVLNQISPPFIDDMGGSQAVITVKNSLCNNY